MSIFDQLLGNIAWHPKHSIGSMISLEFGEPSMQVREPKKPSDVSKILNPLIQRKLLSRSIFIKGQYSLLLSECSWVLELNGSEVSNSESLADRISESIEDLQGQKLVEICCDIGNSVQFEFRFDLGSRLITRSLHDFELQFDLFDNTTNKFLSVRGDGMIASGNSSLKDDELIWKIPKELVVGNSTRFSLYD